MTATAVVHVIDDDASWRKSVARLLSAAGYKTVLYESAQGFLDAPSVDAVGCILLDVRMPGISGLELQQRLVDSRRELPIVFLSGHGDIPMTVSAMKAGAENFLTKPVDHEVLLRAVAGALARSREQRSEREQNDSMRSRVAALTPTERNVFDRVIRGKLNKQIASDLDITERTVKWHRHNLMQKLQMHSVAQITSLGERLGLIERDSVVPQSE
jgi:FixJ family two-component response regulator